METTSGITVRIKGDFIIISQVGALTFVKTMIAIPKIEYEGIKDFIDAHII